MKTRQSHQRRRVCVWFLITALAAVCAGAGHAQTSAYSGRTVVSVLDEFRALGLPIVYSTDLVSDQMRVGSATESGAPLEVAERILRPHGLTLRSEHGLFLVVRDAGQVSVAPATGAALLVLVRREDTMDPIDSPHITVQPALPPPRSMGEGLMQFQAVPDGEYELTVSAPGHAARRHTIAVSNNTTRAVAVNLRQGPAKLDPVVVSTSRYTLERDLLRAPAVLGQHSIETLPDLGDDPLRALQRLPGAAGGGFSARSHIRGGYYDEVAVYLNGLRLFDPYHIRDYQSIFSAVDVRAIDTMEIYTGGFPARYGDSLSALVLINALEPHSQERTEIGISAFNTSLLASGGVDRGETSWLVSARRGNLDLILDKKYGEPSYYDAFAEVGFAPGARTQVSVNALIANDGATVITEFDGSELERIDSTTRNAQFWAVADTNWTPELSSTVLLAYSRFSNLREGRIHEDEKIDGSVYDRRTVRQLRLENHWDWLGWADHRVRFGIEAARLEATYEYTGGVTFDGAFAALATAVSKPVQTRSAAPQGNAFGAFVSDHWQIDRRHAIEVGLRLDRQTYNGLAGRRQISPRLSLHRQLGARTDLRVGWGRFFQSQGIHQLQIEDGVTRFFDAERADHLIIGLQHRFKNGLALRAEAFNKRIRNVRPRFENLLDTLAPIPELYPDRTVVAASQAQIHGLEISLRHEGQPGWWATYTLSNARDTIDGQRIARRVDQRHALQAGFNYAGPRWQFSVAASVHSGWPTTALGLDTSTGEPVIEIGPRNALRHGSFATVDARLARIFTLPRGTLRVFAEVANATNRSNPCCVDFDLGETPNGMPDLELATEHWLGLLPAIGFLWEF